MIVQIFVGYKLLTSTATLPNVTWFALYSGPDGEPIVESGTASISWKYILIYISNSWGNLDTQGGLKNGKKQMKCAWLLITYLKRPKSIFFWGKIDFS